jgi:GT2 family glycosyltransferase
VTETPSLSVVVASHGRPRALRRCLLGLSQSAHAPLEVVVVADAGGLDAAASLPFADRIKTVLQAEPNLARARNDGIAEAAGDIVAFIDDDAVPEPTWAGALVAAFATDPDLAAATGPVLGRNGISVQWGPVAVDRQGRDVALPGGEVALPPGTVRKLHGTNMAFRQEALRRLGGFDPAFRFYLDDTDIALRLAEAGLRTGWVEGAQVHHAFAASARRDAGRVPLDLFDIGASSAVFLRKHAPDEMEAALARLSESQRDRLFRLARKRKLGARGIEALLDSLRQGIAEGRGRAIGGHGIGARGDRFVSVRETPAGPDEVLAGWIFGAPSLRAEAGRLVAQDARVSLFLLDPTPRAHRVTFTDGGWWEQTGGLFGPSDRSARRFRFWTFKSRVFSEMRRIAATRFADRVTKFRDR